MQVPSTPTLVVNGKYRINNDAIQTPEDVIGIVKFLIAKEAGGAKPAQAPAPAAAPAKKS